MSHASPLLLAAGMALTALPALGQSGAAEFLQDTTVIARVDDRKITVFDFRDRYYAISAKYRPDADSVGRVAFLNTLIDKDILGLEARALGVPLTFEDRAVLGAHARTELINTLYTRAIYDSSIATAEDYKRYEPQFGRELRLRRIAFADPVTAEHVRNDLLKKRISWRDAVARSGIPDLGPEGDVGWRSRREFGGDLALRIFDLKAGELSPVVTDNVAFYVFQVLEERKVAPPPQSSMRLIIKLDVNRSKGRILADRLIAAIRSREQVVHDSTKIRWAARRFAQEAAPPAAREGRLAVDLRGRVPAFTPADTAVVLARSRSRTLSLGDLLAAYRSIHPVFRPRLDAFDPLLQMVDRTLLEPQLAEEARARGLESDSLYVAETEKKREALMVEHLYQDSIASRVSITPAQRRRYYEKNRGQFATVARVRYARFIRRSEAGADSLLADLRSGASAESIVTADTASGRHAFILDERDRETLEFRQVLMEELRPGKGTRLGPDNEGNFLILYVLGYEGPREQSYDEVVEVVAESAQNVEAERVLKEYLARLRPKRHIVTRPDLVMRISLRDPGGDDF